jgi:hypothetical protein
MRWLDAVIRVLQHVHHFLLACVQGAEIVTQENTQENAELSELDIKKDL